MTDLPPEITRNLDAHRSALAFIHAMLTDETSRVLDLWFNRPEAERDEIACALATQAAGFLIARYGGGEEGEQAAIHFADRALLEMARAG